MPRTVELLRQSIRRSTAVTSAVGVEQAIVRALAELPVVLVRFFPGHCEVARRLGARMGFPASFINTVGQIYARWDGHGVPSLAGDDVSPAHLCASLAHDAVTFHRLGGVTAAVTMARERSAGATLWAVEHGLT
ncbi:MAG: hypothetical protein JNL92_08685 [Opitutaceae bacterium]|nr:hypothetical protein [Opitutaceae bacterium]